MERSKYSTIIALDFGTTYSGYAYLSKSKFTRNPLKIHVNQAWKSGYRQFLTLKTPTCVLLDIKKEFKCFGYDAENEYGDKCMDDIYNDYYFFRGFNIKKNTTSDLMLKDVTGKTLPASHVFTMFIKAFVYHITEESDKKDASFKKDETRWVIIVSVELTDTSKQTLRSCAEQAGIPLGQLILVTEAEATFAYCQRFMHRNNNQHTQEGTDYMVFDIGGSVADITVIKKVTDGIIEKYRRTGNDCGGTAINMKFLDLLNSIFGKSVMQSLKKEAPDAYLAFIRECEQIKRKVKGSQDKIEMRVPYACLNNICLKIRDESFLNVISTSKYSNDIILMGDSLRIEADIVHTLFKTTINKIIALMEDIFTEHKDSFNVEAIVMIGGLSECMLVQEAVRQRFFRKNVIVPKDACLAIVKVAILCGSQSCQ
ncbi:Hypothetical predicted protein [Mytilus galloprovincialis]|uniref:Uncharacterized protein n=1 Tax=Mytilus galloprovincialis TaxID=29158 RepID=A0A8B6BK77_MYTGA|nr:Hypothetical predicted protein [Mytilus galloprovincialis]